MKKFLISLLCVIALSAVALNVNVMWEPLPEGSVDGYTISIERHTLRDGQTVYVALQPPINVPSSYTNFILRNLTTNVWYRFTITASNKIGKSPTVEISHIPTNFPQKTTTIFQINK